MQWLGGVAEIQLPDFVALTLIPWGEGREEKVIFSRALAPYRPGW